MDIRRVDPHDDGALRAWYDVMRDGAVAGRSAPLVYAYPSLAVSLRVPNPDRGRTPYAGYEGGVPVGTVMLERPYRDNTHLAEIDVSVRPDHRGRGYGTELLRYAAGVAAADGRTTLLGEVYVPHAVADWPGARFAERHGFTTEHQEDHLVLDLPGTPPEAPVAAGYEVVSWTGACPDRYLDGYARMATAMERDVPAGDIDAEPSAWDPGRIRRSEERMAHQGYTLVLAAARDTGGGFAGYSKLLVSAHQPADVLQDDTLVMAEHRGRGLGAALKARNLDVLRTRFPAGTRVHTWTAGVNGAMRHVNAAFGFRPVETLHEVQRIDR